MTNFPLVAIILVNWNRSQDTIDCVQSIETSTYPNYVIIVVDNGSSGESIRQLRKHQDRFILLESSENSGFTGGNNIGIYYALQLNVAYVCLLNNDTIIAPDTLDKLIQVIENDNRVGIVTPKILFYPKQQLIWAAGTEYDARFMIGQLTGYNVEDVGQFDRRRTLAWSTGCAMLIPNRVIREVGVLRDDYFAVAEDMDYSLRVSKAGYVIRYEPSAILWHKESASAGGLDAPQYVYYQIRNYFLLHNRWADNWGHLVISQGYFLLYAAKRALLFAVRGRWRSMTAIIYGIRDAFIGRVGRREYKTLI